jgi:hypothetical protein
LQDVAWALDVMDCFANKILPFRCSEQARDSSCSNMAVEEEGAVAIQRQNEAKEAASFAIAILETLSGVMRSADLSDMTVDHADVAAGTSAAAGEEEPGDMAPCFYSAFWAASAACVRCLVAKCSDQEQQGGYSKSLPCQYQQRI